MMAFCTCTKHVPLPVCTQKNISRHKLCRRVLPVTLREDMHCASERGQQPHRYNHILFSNFRFETDFASVRSNRARSEKKAISLSSLLHSETTKTHIKGYLLLIFPNHRAPIASFVQRHASRIVHVVKSPSTRCTVLIVK